METLLKNRVTDNATAETDAQLQHNAMIKERYRRLQNAEADQFAESAEETTAQTDYTVRASVLAPERPAYAAPVTETPMTQQTPQVTEYVRTRIDNPVFTTEKFNSVNDARSEEYTSAPTQTAAEMPVQIYAPAQTAAATETQYSFSRMAKIAMAAFAAVVTLMLAFIGINTQLIQRKSVELRALEVQRDALIRENEEIQRRIAEAKSEETIRRYVESQGMIGQNG